MAGEQTPFRRTKSIAGATLLGLGTFLQYQNMAEAVARLRNVLYANGSETLGVPPAVVQAFAQAWPAYIANRQRFLCTFLQLVLVSCWPLLLVTAGTVLSRDSSVQNADRFPKKDGAVVELRASGSTLK